VLFPIPRRIERVHLSISSPSARPSPNRGRVGIRNFTFEACSGFTHVTARRIARPPGSCIRCAAFVTRLRSGQLPNRAARQLPDLSTPIWVEPSSTGHPCLRGTPLHRVNLRLQRSVVALYGCATTRSRGNKKGPRQRRGPLIGYLAGNPAGYQRRQS
jgi:hypothetical protein